MDELHRRVAEKKAQGLYSIDALSDEIRPGPEPVDADGLARLERLVDVAPDPSVVRSTKPVIGGAVTGAKHVLVRATRQPVDDLACRATTFNGLLLHHLAGLAREVALLQARVDELERALSAVKPAASA